MKLLVTAGNTQAQLDRVRCITNIFSGRTGARIAATGFDRGHSVVFLTSHPEVLDTIPAVRARAAPDWRVCPYRTFDDLAALMAEEIGRGDFDALIHAAAVSDYRPAGVFAPAPGTSFDSQALAWDGAGGCPRLADAMQDKVKSTHPELWLRLVPTPKLVDKIRSDWGFGGVLVKFKLEVGLSESDLLAAAEPARVHSQADLMVSNTLEGMSEWALLGGASGYRKVAREDLADCLLHAMEELARR